VTFGIPGRAASGSVPSARTAPLARISRSALELNLRAVLSSSADGIVDVRADAWGHGLEFVATTALSEGAQAVMVDETGVARLAGAVEPARLVSAGASADSQAVYGLTPGFAPVLSLVGAVGAALTLGVRGGGVLLALLILPLYVPVLIFGAGAVEADAAGLDPSGHLLLLGAMFVLGAFFAPWATTAALRISLE
jgi:hypothetical protein